MINLNPSVKKLIFCWPIFVLSVAISGILLEFQTQIEKDNYQLQSGRNNSQHNNAERSVWAVAIKSTLKYYKDMVRFTFESNEIID